MQILSNAQEIHKELKRLIRKYTKYSWAVAWASTSFDGFEVLTKNKRRIHRMAIGIHFYQTHPDFIREFADVDGVKFIMRPDGLFHPKVYMFEDGEGRWECIIGSANFTRSAFSTNSEMAVLISSDDLGADEAYQDIVETIEAYWSEGRRVDHSDLASYADVWGRKRKSLESISGRYGDLNKPVKSPMDIEIFKITWQEFFQRVQSEQHNSPHGRIRVLKAARDRFHSHPHFKDMTVEARKELAGLVVGDEEIRWTRFGSMKPAGYFKQAVNQNNDYISLALDQIPLEGSLSRKQYQGFADLFQKAFESGGAGIATATRLLAMKRPDYFVCLDSKNKDRLCKAFGIPKSIRFDNYWGLIVERIIDSVWWCSKEPTDPVELAVWNGRVAFLDSLFYDPSA